jgi:Glycosyltransferases involved in cell wall biogenesis
MSEVKVSVVIPTLNSAQTLEKCLSSIRSNNSKYKYEIIVADAGSKDETLEIAKRYADKVLAGMPKRINRNVGVQDAEGEIICFTDSDCVVPDNWIDELANGLLRLNRIFQP